MKHIVGKWLLCLLALCLGNASRVAALQVSLEEYRSQLHELSRKIESLPAHPQDAARIETSIPETVVVNTPSGEITVKYHDLKSDLSAFARGNEKKRETLGPRLSNYIDTLESQAAFFDRDHADPAKAKQQLQSILARREFHRVEEQPSLINIILSRILVWLVRFFSRLPFGSSTFNWFQILVYCLVGAALIVLLLWTIRRLRSRPEDPAMREIIPFAPSARSWRTWLDESRSLAQREDWRGAIHLGYWAGISFLEEHGSWRPNRARTPREYLSLITSRNPNYPALSSLTRKFELVWYGSREARESDFQETVGQLEKLGCR